MRFQLYLFILFVCAVVVVVVVVVVVDVVCSSSRPDSRGGFWRRDKQIFCAFLFVFWPFSTGHRRSKANAVIT